MSDQSRAIFEQAIKAGMELGAADWHFTPGERAAYTVHGLIRWHDGPIWSAEDILVVLQSLSKPSLTLSDLWTPLDSTITIRVNESCHRRFRLHAKKMQGGPAFNLRLIAQRPMELEALGVPPAFSNLLLNRSEGLMLVCGATGSGKSSTMSACVGNYLRQRAGKVITFEAPVEVIYEQGLGLVQQHEVGPLAASGDIADFLTATVAAMRDAPNVIKIGEIREMSVLREAVAVAETGHLVIGTMHTGNAMSSISRLIGAAEDDAFLQKLGTKLLGVLCQRLVRIPGGRIANFELLLGCPGLTGAITNRRPLDVANVMMSSAALGHFTFDAHLLTLVQAKRISAADAVQQAPLPEAMFKLLSAKQLLPEHDPKTKELRKLYAS